MAFMSTVRAVGQQSVLHVGAEHKGFLLATSHTNLGLATSPTHVHAHVHVHGHVAHMQFALCTVQHAHACALHRWRHLVQDGIVEGVGHAEDLAPGQG